LGSNKNAYLNKGDYDYFNFYNAKAEAGVLFLISSHASICHKVGITEGNNDVTKGVNLNH
jgi:hypothetical protein